MVVPHRPPPLRIAPDCGWRPNPGPQTRALSVLVYELLFGGARGGGKTDTSVPWLARPACCDNPSPRYRGLVIRQNGKDLGDWIDRAEWQWAAYGAKPVGSPVIFRWPSGAKIVTGHLKDRDAFKHYQGQEFQRMVVEELTQIPHEEDYLRLVASVRSTVPGLMPAIFATTNPGGPGHAWVKRRFVDPSPPGLAFRDKVTRRWRLFIRSLIDDNPILRENDPGYEAGLLGLADATVRAWRFGDWDAFEGQYFLEWSRTRHVVQAFRIPRGWKRYRAVDWGYWPNPWACGWYAVDERGHEFKYREERGNRMTPGEVARRILELSAEDGALFGPTVADPSMWSTDDGQSHAEMFAKAGLPLVQAFNDRVQGWTRVHEYLADNPETGLPWLRVFDTCLETIRTLPMLIHDDVRVEDVRKDNALDHHPDELRYHLMRRPSRAQPAEHAAPWNSVERFEQIADGIIDEDSH